ncbi:AraC family ligand binding domain-containing protein [Pectinatus brassicae]|uniref:AraC-like DNA-binding protein n=1 Tax=Pectinatus brassicae TaxID=862415 RepID=A0A840UW93_9FIRM|nr:AraC family transcriptional regulator [Pectinatus brassicae]MBB5337104.1 AraC-like DNA-binding protein [Pectinatus brassicae]
MPQEIRNIKYDDILKIEAYQFKGIMQKFPNHFHEHYVIGFIEKGNRYLSCKNKTYIIQPGVLLIFNPHDNHACEQIDNQNLDYRCINIQPEIMENFILEITGKPYQPVFTSQVIFNDELVNTLRKLHEMILEGSAVLQKEETLFSLLEQLLTEYTAKKNTSQNINIPIQKVCSFIKQHYRENISLTDLAAIAELNKYYLLRLFTKQTGISPYSYLETIRINKAKALLQHGTLPIDAALQTGFTDQSHFSKFFKKFIGLTPKQYMNIFKNFND